MNAPIVAATTVGIIGVIVGATLAALAIVAIVLNVYWRARPKQRCPDCAEWVFIDARVCAHCGYRFDNGERD